MESTPLKPECCCLQIHFHAAAEHTFNGTRASVEAHVVHKDPATSEGSR